MMIPGSFELILGWSHLRISGPTPLLRLIGSSFLASLVKKYSARSSVFVLRQMWFLSWNWNGGVSWCSWFLSLLMSLDHFPSRLSEDCKVDFDYQD